MKSLGLTAAASTLILMSGIAAAQQDRATERTVNREPARECLDELDRVKRQYDQAQLSDTVREEVDQLSESARILGEAGREDACDTMVETISNMTEESHSRTLEKEGLHALRDAPLVTDYDGIVRASDVTGATVRNMENEELGTIEEAVIEASSGEISYVALSVGGFLGVGERLVAVPWKELRFVRDDDGDSFYVIEASREYLENREALSGDSWPRELEEDWEPPAAERRRQ